MPSMPVVECFCLSISIIFTSCISLHKGNLIKASLTFERLNLHFKSTLPSNTQNKYLLTVADEYYILVFAVPCTDVSTAMAVNLLFLENLHKYV